MIMTNNKYHFYDTSALLEKSKYLDDNENIVISTTVLEELENLKESKSKDDTIKQQARRVIHYIYENPTKIKVVCFKDEMMTPIVNKGLSTITPDLKILAAAIWFDTNEAPDDVSFYTNDLSLANLANLFFGEDSIYSIDPEDADHYKGYCTLQLSQDQLCQLYEHMDIPFTDHYNNEYIFVKDEQGDLIDTLCWTGQKYRHLVFAEFESSMFGKIKPIKNDEYQQCAFDSLVHNQITLLKGPAGTGKSMIALSYLFSQLEKGRIDKIIVFCNTIATKNSAKLGFYPGDRNAKLLDSQIGNFFASKLGSKMEVERLVNEEKIILLPMSDIRGYDTSGMNAGIYITEAQNMDVSLMKLALQRIGEDSVVVIDGDCQTQVDLPAFSGNNNGMRRLSEVFRGESLYGEIELKNIHRSRIGAIAEKM